MNLTQVINECYPCLLWQTDITYRVDVTREYWDEVREEVYQNEKDYGGCIVYCCLLDK